METNILADFDRVPAPAGEEDAVAGLDDGGDDLPVLVGRARADGDDGRLRQRRVDGRGRQEDTRRCFLEKKRGGSWWVRLRKYAGG